MKFSNYINEASNKFIKILSKKSLSDFTRTNYTVKNKTGGELRFNGDSKSCEYCYTNGSSIFSVKGEDFWVATRVGPSTIEFIIYDNEGDFINSEFIKLKKGVELFRNVIPGLEMPAVLKFLGKETLTDKFSTIERDGNNIKFILKNGAIKKLYLGRVVKGSSDLPRAKREILNFISLLEENGQKVRRKIMTQLEVLFPEIFGEVDFVLDDSIVHLLDNFSKDAYYAKFINGMDNDSRTGWGVHIDENGVQVHGMIGNLSTGFNSKRFEFKKKPTNLAGLKRFMKSSGAIDYIIELSKAIFGEMESYRNYVKNGGVLD
jgi:hypothetical protein